MVSIRFVTIIKKKFILFQWPFSKSEFVKMYNKIDGHVIVVEEPAHCPDDDVFSRSTPA